MDLENLNKDRDVVVIAGLDSLDGIEEMQSDGFERIILVIPPAYKRYSEPFAKVPVCTSRAELLEVLASYERPVPVKAAFGNSGQSGYSAEELDGINDTITKTLQRIASNEGTYRHFNEVWQRNAGENLGHIQALQKSILDEKSQWQGKPIVVVGAGPSLDHCVTELKQIRDKVCVAAAGHSLLALDKAGIVPDYCMVLDAQDARWHFTNFSTSEYLGQITGLLGVTVDPSCFKFPFKDIIPFNGNDQVVDWVNGHLDSPLHSLLAGGSVLTSLAALGIDWECSKVCLIGADLSFPNGKVYADITCDGGTRIQLNDERDKFKYANGSKDLMELFKDEQKPLTFAPGIFGGMLPSCHQFEIYRTYLDWLATSNPGSLYQCSNQGAYIEGATHCSLKEAIQ